MKILLIFPSLAESGFNKAPQALLYRHIHPGLCYLSAMCKDEGFGDVHLLDLRTMAGWDEVAKAVEEIAPDVAGITAMSPDFTYAMRCAGIIKETSPATKTVIGGIHPTVKTGEVAGNTTIDHIITGEGETAFVNLLRDLGAGKTVDRIIRGTRPDVDSLPFMDRELFDCLEMPYDFFLPLPFVTVLAGRGCNYGCRFCSPASKIMYGPRIRKRSVENVIEELEFLRATYGFKSFMFWDDSFTEEKEWVMAFCDRYEAAGFTQPFVCQTRVDTICRYPDMMRRLKDAGLVMASIGFESGNDRVLQFINKGTTREQNVKAAKICRELRIKIWAYNMFGFPTERNAEARDTMRMIRRVDPYRSSAAFFTPHPGSFFYDYCKQHNLSLIDDHDDFVRFPEVDKPKIKNVDYDFMRKMAILSKRPSFRVKTKMRVEKILAHKKNKPFKTMFEEELKAHPAMNKMALLRTARAAGRA